MKRISIVMVVLGGGLAALGLSGFHTAFGAARWDTGDRIEIAIGVALFVLGMIVRKEGR